MKFDIMTNDIKFLPLNQTSIWFLFWHKVSKFKTCSRNRGRGFKNSFFNPWCCQVWSMKGNCNIARAWKMHTKDMSTDYWVVFIFENVMPFTLVQFKIKNSTPNTIYLVRMLYCWKKKLSTWYVKNLNFKPLKTWNITVKKKKKLEIPCSRMINAEYGIAYIYRHIVTNTTWQIVTTNSYNKPSSQHVKSDRILKIHVSTVGHI